MPEAEEMPSVDEVIKFLKLDGTFDRTRDEAINEVLGKSDPLHYQKLKRYIEKRAERAMDDFWLAVQVGRRNLDHAPPSKREMFQFACKELDNSRIARDFRDDTEYEILRGPMSVKIETDVGRAVDAILRGEKPAQPTRKSAPSKRAPSSAEPHPPPMPPNSIIEIETRKPDSTQVSVKAEKGPMFAQRPSPHDLKPPLHQTQKSSPLRKTVSSAKLGPQVDLLSLPKRPPDVDHAPNRSGMLGIKSKDIRDSVLDGGPQPKQSTSDKTTKETPPQDQISKQETEKKKWKLEAVKPPNMKNSAIKKACAHLLGKKISKDKYVDFFAKPVDIMGYTNEIKFPMDLGTVNENFENDQYETMFDLFRDLELIWANCLHYNKNLSPAWKAADNLANMTQDHKSKVVKYFELESHDTQVDPRLPDKSKPIHQKPRVKLKPESSISRREQSAKAGRLERKSKSSRPRVSTDPSAEIQIDSKEQIEPSPQERKPSKGETRNESPNTSDYEVAPTKVAAKPATNLPDSMSIETKKAKVQEDVEANTEEDSRKISGRVKRATIRLEKEEGSWEQSAIVDEEIGQTKQKEDHRKKTQRLGKIKKKVIIKETKLTGTDDYEDRGTERKHSKVEKVQTEDTEATERSRNESRRKEKEIGADGENKGVNDKTRSGAANSEESMGGGKEGEVSKTATEETNESPKGKQESEGSKVRSEATKRPARSKKKAIEKEERDSEGAIERRKAKRATKKEANEEIFESRNVSEGRCRQTDEEIQGSREAVKAASRRGGSDEAVKGESKSEKPGGKRVKAKDETVILARPASPLNADNIKSEKRRPSRVAKKASTRTEEKEPIDDEHGGRDVEPKPKKTKGGGVRVSKKRKGDAIKKTETRKNTQASDEEGGPDGGEEENSRFSVDVFGWRDIMDFQIEDETRRLLERFLKHCRKNNGRYFWVARKDVKEDGIKRSYLGDICERIRGTAYKFVCLDDFFEAYVDHMMSWEGHPEIAANAFSCLYDEEYLPSYIKQMHEHVDEVEAREAMETKGPGVREVGLNVEVGAENTRDGDLDNDAEADSAKDDDEPQNRSKLKGREATTGSDRNRRKYDQVDGAGCEDEESDTSRHRKQPQMTGAAEDGEAADPTESRERHHAKHRRKGVDEESNDSTKDPTSEVGKPVPRGNRELRKKRKKSQASNVNEEQALMPSAADDGRDVRVKRKKNGREKLRDQDNDGRK